MTTQEIITAVNQVGARHGLEPLRVGPPETSSALGAPLPPDLDDFFATCGRVSAFDLGSTTPLEALVRESRSLTQSLARHARLAKHQVRRALEAGAR